MQSGLCVFAGVLLGMGIGTQYNGNLGGAFLYVLGGFITLAVTITIEQYNKHNPPKG